MTTHTRQGFNNVSGANAGPHAAGFLGATLVVATFLVCSNFAGYGIYGVIVAVPSLVVLAYRNGVRLSLALVALIMFAGLHALYFEGEFFNKLILGPLAILMFAIGMIYSRSVGSSQLILLAGSFGAAAYAVGNLATNLLAAGPPSSGRYQIDFWTSAETSATVHGGLWIPAIGAVPFLMARTGKFSLTGKVAGIGIGVLGVTYSLTSATRTPMLILILVGVICLVRFGNRRTAVPALTALTAFLGTLFAAFRAFGIRWSESALIERITSSDAAELGQDVRFERQAMFIENIGDYSGGGLFFRSAYGYVHNIILDEIDSASILPASFLAVFIFITVIAALSQSRGPVDPGAGKVLVFGLAVALVASFMVEPTLEAAHISFLVFCVLAGALTATGKGGRFAPSYGRPR